jgi:uncharacterized protein YecA (UPF0149 family)
MMQDYKDRVKLGVSPSSTVTTLYAINSEDELQQMLDEIEVQVEVAQQEMTDLQFLVKQLRKLLEEKKEWLME